MTRLTKHPVAVEFWSCPCLTCCYLDYLGAGQIHAPGGGRPAQVHPAAQAFPGDAHLHWAGGVLLWGQVQLHQFSTSGGGDKASFIHFKEN